MQKVWLLLNIVKKNNLVSWISIELNRCCIPTLFWGGLGHCAKKAKFYIASLIRVGWFLGWPGRFHNVVSSLAGPLPGCCRNDFGIRRWQKTSTKGILNLSILLNMSACTFLTSQWGFSFTPLGGKFPETWNNHVYCAWRVKT